MDTRALVALVEHDGAIDNGTQLCHMYGEVNILPWEFMCENTDCSKCIASGYADARKVIKWIKDL